MFLHQAQGHANVVVNYYWVLQYQPGICHSTRFLLAVTAFLVLHKRACLTIQVPDSCDENRAYRRNPVSSIYLDY